MKKIVAMLLALMMACMMLPALAEAADLTGDWFGNMFGMAIQIVLKEDNTYDLVIGGEVANSGTWESKDGYVIMDGDENLANAFVIDGETLNCEAQGVTLTRDAEAVEAITVGEPVAAELEAFAGSWECAYVAYHGSLVDVAKGKDVMGLSDVPALAIDGTNVSMKGLGLEDLLGTDTLEAAYEDGTLTATLLFNDEPLMVFGLQMLDDGLLELTMTDDESENYLYFAPAAAEEAPAA